MKVTLKRYCISPSYAILIKKGEGGIALHGGIYSGHVSDVKNRPKEQTPQYKLSMQGAWTFWAAAWNLESKLISLPVFRKLYFLFYMVAVIQFLAGLQGRGASRKQSPDTDAPLPGAAGPPGLHRTCILLSLPGDSQSPTTIVTAIKRGPENPSFWLRGNQNRGSGSK